MLTIAIVLLTLAAMIGISLASDTFKAVPSPLGLRILHAGLSCTGAVLLIITAYTGDARLWINVGLALLFIPLGCMLGYKRSRGIHSKSLATAHGGLAVVCFAILLYNAYGPR